MQSELGAFADTKGGLVNSAMVADLFGPLFWMYYDEHEGDKIFHLKLKWKIIRPSVSVYLRDIRPFFERVFGPHP